MQTESQKGAEVHFDPLPVKLDFHAAAAPDRIAVVDLEGDRRITYGQVAHDSIKFAAFLVERGVKPGDVVSVQLPNWYETVVVGIGILRAGATVNPLLPSYGPKELGHIIQVGDPVMLVTPSQYRNRRFDDIVTAAVGAEQSAKIDHLLIDDPHRQHDLLDDVTDGVGEYPLLERDPLAVSELIFTSGSESTPKAILHSEKTAGWATNVVADGHGLTMNDVVWMPQPVGHSTGFNFGIRLALYRGMKLVLQDKWDPAVGVDLCLSEGATFTSVAPTFLFDLLAELDARRTSFDGFRYFGCAGAPVPAQAVIDAERYGMTVIRGYGSTETLAVSNNHPDFSRQKRIETDGRILPDVELEIRDPDGALQPQGEPGEIYVRNPGVCLGFAGDPERTAAVIDSDGWVRTGDIGSVDSDRFLTLTGRQKDIIIRGGMNISPREIEDLIRRHPEVHDAAVIGIPDARLGEVACACIVTKSGSVVAMENLSAHLLESGLAKYKLPERLELFDELPKSEIGKVQKDILKQRVGARSGGDI